MMQSSGEGRTTAAPEDCPSRPCFSTFFFSGRADAGAKRPGPECAPLDAEKPSLACLGAAGGAALGGAAPSSFPGEGARAKLANNVCWRPPKPNPFGLPIPGGISQQKSAASRGCGLCEELQARCALRCSGGCSSGFPPLSRETDSRLETRFKLRGPLSLSRDPAFRSSKS